MKSARGRLPPFPAVRVRPIADLSYIADDGEMKRSLVSIASLLCSSCVLTIEDRSTTARLFAEAVPFCEMMAKRQSYLGHKTSVRAFWVSNPEYTSIFDDNRNCPKDAIQLRNLLKPDRQAASIISAQQRHHYYPEVVLRGALKRRHVILQCEDEDCYEYYFSDVQVVASRPGHPFHDLSTH